MTHTAATNWVPRIFASMALSMIVFNCVATSSRPVVDICQLLDNMHTFEGKSIELHSEIKFTEHGRHQFSRQCPNMGSLGLSISEDQYKDKKTISFIRKIFNQGGTGSIIILGQPIRKAFGNFKGYFILENVIEVNGSETHRS